MDIIQGNEKETPISCLIIKDFSDNYIRYDFINSSIAIEIRNFLERLPITFFFLNYDLEIASTGTKLKDDDNLFTMELKDYDLIQMTPVLYNTRTAKEHIEKMKYVIQEYPLLSNDIENLSEYISTDYDKLVEKTKEAYANKRVNNSYSNFNYLLEDSELLREALEGAEEEEKPEKSEKPEKEKEKPEKAETSQTNEKPNEKKPETKPTDEGNKEEISDQSGSAKIKELQKNILEIDYKAFSLRNLTKGILYESNIIRKFKCLKSIFYSSYNSLLESAELSSSDLIYLEVETVENKHLYITAHERGFFVNRSTQDCFDPRLDGNLQSFTLPGLLSIVSSSFKENFTKTITQEVNGDWKLFLPSPSDKFDWIVDQPDENSYGLRFKSFSFDKVENLILNKEWNEEYQGIIDLKQMDGIQIETKEKLLVPFYNQFKEVAMEGAKLIVHKKLKSFNFSDATTSGYYMYGNIFFTVLEDPADFKVRSIT